MGCGCSRPEHSVADVRASRSLWYSNLAASEMVATPPDQPGALSNHDGHGVQASHLSVVLSQCYLGVVTATYPRPWKLVICLDFHGGTSVSGSEEGLVSLGPQHSFKKHSVRMFHIL